MIFKYFLMPDSYRRNGGFSKLLSTGKKRRRDEIEEEKSSLGVEEIEQQLNYKQKIIEQLKSEVDKFEREREDSSAGRPNKTSEALSHGSYRRSWRYDPAQSK